MHMLTSRKAEIKDIYEEGGRSCRKESKSEKAKLKYSVLLKWLDEVYSCDTE